jgi:hypothetical protein
MQTIPESVAVEARAKIFWGESSAKVLAFLQTKGVGDKDAFALIDEIEAERRREVRSRGFKKLWIGVFLVSMPVLIYFMKSHGAEAQMGSKGFAAAIVLGCIGLASITNGLSMIMRPSRATGDLSNGRDLAG